MNEIDDYSQNDEIKTWFLEIEAAKKREKAFREDGDRINKIYACSDDEKVQFNILFSNTDTLIPALYSQVPSPVVQRRFKDEDPLGKAASEASERVLEFLLDTNVDGYETFDDGMNAAVAHALLPGRGVTGIKYDAEVNDDMKSSELVCVDSKPWDRVLFGFATKWSRMPWIAFEENIDKEEAVRLFGEEMAEKIDYMLDNDGSDSDKNESGDDNDKDDDDDKQGQRKTAVIYQIWDKDGGRKVRYISKSYKENFLKVDDDPLELTGFFPIPRPLAFIYKANDLTPVAPYLIYENQAKELNELTRRINNLVRAIKAKGVYDSELGSDIANLISGEENTFIPADKSAMLSKDRGFDNSIWFMPIEKMVQVLRELYNAREACKQTIYEVTGISDIIRGSTVASETATAQNIKSQWGTMRLKRNQGEVQRYARDLLRLMLEVAASKFSEETWAQMTGLPFLTEQQAQQAQIVLQSFQQMPQPPAQPGQPPQIPPQVQQAQQALQQPKWSQVLALLKNDMQRAYKIDIETNSTIMPEATEDKQKMSEALGALAQFIGQAMPQVQAGVLPFAAVKSIMMKIARQFEFGEDIEMELEQMQQPQPPKPPEDNTMQVKQMDMQAKQQELQLKQQTDSAKMEFDLKIEEGKAATQMRIKEMEIASQEKIAIEIENIKARCSMKQAVINANASKGESESMYDEEGELMMAPRPFEQIMAAITQSYGELKNDIDTLMAIQTAPKTIVKDEDGTPIGVETPFSSQMIRRDNNGNIIGLQ